MVAGLLRLAVGWRMMASVLGWWSAAGGSGAASRRRRRERPDLEVEGMLGAGPRPACHSDRWAPCVLLLEVHKARWRWSFFNLGCGGRCSFSSLCVGVGDEGWSRSGGAESSEDLYVILSSSRVLSAFCTARCVLLGRFVLCVRIMYFVCP